MNASSINVDNSLQRLRYFFGQLLTQRDLSAEQAFHLVLQRLTQRESFGTGTVAGLRVVSELDSTPTPLSVFVLAGLAMDPDGRELLLESPACVLVADEPLSATPFPFSPVPVDRASLAAVVHSTFGPPFAVGDLDTVVTRLFERGLMDQGERDAYFTSGTIGVIKGLLELIEPSTPVLTPPVTLADWLVDQLVGTTYVGIRYLEHGAEPAPAVLDAACCGGAQCFASRDREGISLSTSATPFPEIADPFAEFQSCLAGDTAQACECLLDAWRELPAASDCPPLDTPIVPLAQVFWAKHERAPESQILSIDNCDLRPLAPGGPMLRALTGAPWFRPEVSNGSVSGATAINFKSGPAQTVTLTGNAPLTLSFPGVGNYVLRVVQGPSGGPFTPVLSVSGGSVLAPGGTLTYTAASNATDILRLYFNGQNVYAVMAANFSVV